jgi:hypothetical protein
MSGCQHYRSRPSRASSLLQWVSKWLGPRTCAQLPPTIASRRLMAAPNITWSFTMDQTLPPPAESEMLAEITAKRVLDQIDTAVDAERSPRRSCRRLLLRDRARWRHASVGAGLFSRKSLGPGAAGTGCSTSPAVARGRWVCETGRAPAGAACR